MQTLDVKNNEVFQLAKRRLGSLAAVHARRRMYRNLGTKDFASYQRTRSFQADYRAQRNGGRWGQIRVASGA